MSYRLEADETVENGVRRIAGEQIAKAIGEVEDSELGPEETVHQVRKRCKKIRAVLRLTRPSFEETYGRENAFFRDAARELSELRDATSRIESLDGLRKSCTSEAKNLDTVRDALSEDRDARYREGHVDERLARFRDGMRAARGRLGAWTLDAQAFDAVGPGAKKTYRRARTAMDTAYEEGTAEAFHEWRKRVKYHRYHVRILRNLWEPVLEARRERLRALSDLLGDAHDLAVLRRWLVEERDPLGSEGELQQVLVLADSRRKELDARALPLGRRLFADAPKNWKSRLGAYWEGWDLERKLAPVLG